MKKKKDNNTDTLLAGCGMAMLILFAIVGYFVDPNIAVAFFGIICFAAGTLSK